MTRRVQYAMFVVALIGVAFVASFAWAGGHGGHGGGHGGHGWSGGHGGFSWHGGHGHFDGRSQFAWNGGWGHGHLGHDHGDHFHWGSWAPYLAWSYLNGWSYYDYYRPYSVYSYPNYAYPDYGDDCYDNYATYTEPLPEYVVNRPFLGVAKLEVRLPDPQAKIWVEGQQTRPIGTVRHFNSPVLVASQPYVYTIRAEWHDGDRLVTDERKVNVQVDSSAVVDFNQPSQTARVGSTRLTSDYPLTQGQVTAADLRD